MTNVITASQQVEAGHRVSTLFREFWAAISAGGVKEPSPATAPLGRPRAI